MNKTTKSKLHGVFASVKTAFSKTKSVVSRCATKVAAAVVGIGSAVLASKPAHAALDLTGVSVDTTDYITIATFLITALVAFWGIKKGIALLGR